MFTPLVFACTGDARRRGAPERPRRRGARSLPVPDANAPRLRPDHSSKSSAWFGARVGELVKNFGGNIDGLACLERGSFGAQTHFPFTFENQVNLFLLLIVPRDLAPMGLQRDAPHREVFCPDGTGSPHEVLRSAPRRISADSDFCKISNDHDALSPLDEVAS